MFKNKHTATKTLVILSFFAALSIVLSRFCVIWITNSIRINFGNIPIILAGTFFGPIAGALVGMVSDIIGSSLLSGLGWYPPLTVSPMLMGIIPGIMAPLMSRLKCRTNGRRTAYAELSIITVAGLVMPANIIATMGWTTYWLHVLYGSPMGALLSVRVPLYFCMGILEILIIFTLSKAGAFRTLKLKTYGGMRSGL